MGTTSARVPGTGPDPGSGKDSARASSGNSPVVAAPPALASCTSQGLGLGHPVSFAPSILDSVLASGLVGESAPLLYSPMSSVAASFWSG